MYCGMRCLNCSTKNGRSGRGPTSDMSPLKHVPELRNLVEVRAAQEPADRRAARIVLAGPDRAGVALGLVVHRAELPHAERVAVEAHALLAEEGRTRRAEPDQQRRARRAPGTSTSRPAADSPTSMARFSTLLKPRSGTSWMLMIGMPSSSSRRARSAITWTRSGTTLTSTISRLALSTSADHLHVLVERQGDVELIDPIALQDVAGLGQRAEQRQAAIADVVAAGLVVDEADHLVAELVVLEQLVDDHPAQLAGAGDEDALEADALAPAPLQRFADQLARGVGERDVDDEEEAPDQLRHLERAAVLQVRRGRSRPGCRGCVTMPRTTARMLPTNTAKKSSTRVRPRRSR